VLLDFTDGIATLRLNRPDDGNAINPDLAADLSPRLRRRSPSGPTFAPY
jgi:2-(1,2-epoxy-1,2-dihydrophenyl)acetyl-CoA isomerase